MHRRHHSPYRVRAEGACHIGLRLSMVHHGEVNANQRAQKPAIVPGLKRTALSTRYVDWEEAETEPLVVGIVK